MAAEKSKLPSAFSLFSKSWEAVQRNSNVFAILYFLPLIATLVTTMNSSSSSSYTWESSGDSVFGGWSSWAIVGVVGGAFVVGIFVALIGIVIQTMVIVAELESARGKTVELREVWRTARPLIWRMFGLQISMAALIILGFVLLIVPGFIAIRRYFLAPYFLADRDLKVREALKQSAERSKSFSGAIWGVIGVSILLSFTGIVPVIGGLVSFLLGVAYSVAPALRYFELKEASK